MPPCLFIRKGYVLVYNPETSVHMANFVLDAIVNARRTRDAIRQIRQIPTTERDKKYLLGAWFDEHAGAFRGLGEGEGKAARKNAYDQLLGRAGNARLRG